MYNCFSANHLDKIYVHITCMYMCKYLYPQNEWYNHNTHSVGFLLIMESASVITKKSNSSNHI